MISVLKVFKGGRRKMSNRDVGKIYFFRFRNVWGLNFGFIIF